MLTKDLLKFRVRKGAVEPQFAAADDGELIAWLAALQACAQDGTGRSLAELEAAWEAHGLDRQALYPGFKKLILDAASYAEDDGRIARQRWEWLSEAQRLRSEQLFARPAAFHEALGRLFERPFAAVSEELYADLPECRQIRAWRSDEPHELVKRYNCAQVQGLLLRARRVKLVLVEATLREKRDLFRALKFHQLVAEVQGEGRALAEGGLQVELSGPLSILQSQQTYGARLASFFPCLLHLKKWELEASIQLPEKRQELTLSLSEASQLASPYPAPKSYIPPELQDFFSSFNSSAKEIWRALPAEDFIHLGQQSYCFPDAVFESQGGEKIYLELFHKWHWHQLEKRLSVLLKNSEKRLVLGVCRSIAKKPQIKKILEESSWFGEHGLLFSDFPTPRALLGVLGRSRGL